MKTLNDFFAGEQNAHILSLVELVAVKGGDTPPENPVDPFKRPTKLSSSSFHRNFRSY
ncbi:MAG: hypothetical protein ACERKD_18435 [Prolixibacteraceae bacterium]